jgi:hypothetical protein
MQGQCSVASIRNIMYLIMLIPHVFDFLTGIMFHVSCLYHMHYMIMVNTQIKLQVYLRSGVSYACISFAIMRNV